MKRVLLYGGAFNPVTVGHIQVAEQVLEATSGEYDGIHFLPCYKSISGKNMESSIHRLHMLKLALLDMFTPGLDICDLEIKHEMVGGSIDIIKRIKTLSQGIVDYDGFIIGLDQANSIHTWVDSDLLVKENKFVVVNRASYNITKDSWYTREPHTLLQDCSSVEISSTKARKEIIEFGCTKLVSQTVMDYILEHNLYTGKES